jgi:hypothetical protein
VEIVATINHEGVELKARHRAKNPSLSRSCQTKAVLVTPNLSLMEGTIKSAAVITWAE